MDVVYYYPLVLIGVRVHLFPSRTQKLSLLSPTIVAGRLAAKIGNANTITGLPKGGPVFYACSRWLRLGVDGRWAFGRFLFGGGREQIGSAAGGKAAGQDKARQACGCCFIRNAPFCFLLLCIGRERHKFYPLPVLCSGRRNRRWQGGAKSQIVSLTFMQRRRVCGHVSRILF